MREIHLSRGLVSLVDEDDYESVMAAGPWHAKRSGTGNYARRHLRAGSPTTHIFLHTFLTGWPLTDHINGDGLDNRRSNLRPATNAENSRNRGPAWNNTSGFKGVSWHRRGGKWWAQIKADGRHRSLGLHVTPEAAARAYDEAARELHGEFARLNFPGGDGQ